MNGKCILLNSNASKRLQQKNQLMKMKGWLPYPNIIFWIPCLKKSTMILHELQPKSVIHLYLC